MVIVTLWYNNFEASDSAVAWTLGTMRGIQLTQYVKVRIIQFRHGMNNAI